MLFVALYAIGTGLVGANLTYKINDTQGGENLWRGYVGGLLWPITLIVICFNKTVLERTDF